MPDRYSEALLMDSYPAFGKLASPGKWSGAKLKTLRQGSLSLRELCQGELLWQAGSQVVHGILLIYPLGTESRTRKEEMALRGDV